MEKNQIIELEITDMLDDGRAFGRYEGCAVFITGGAVPGDVIRAEVTRAKKNSAEAVFISAVTPSVDRIPAECPYYGMCGGCTLQEMSYSSQKRLKTRQIRAKLEKIGGLCEPVVHDIIGAETLKYYRNKGTFAVGPHGEVGFVKGRSHYVMDIEDCLLQSDAAMVCADALRAFLKETGAKCISQMTVRTAFGTGEVMVSLESDVREVPGIDHLTELLDDAVYSLGLGEDGEPADDVFFSLESVSVIHKGKCRIIAGKPTITEEVITDDGRTMRFEISPQSFYQVNPEQMMKLYDKSAEYTGLFSCDGADASGSEAAPEFSAADAPDTRPAAECDHGEELSQYTVLDLYCGTGTIGIWLLDMLRSRRSEIFGRTRVIGIESVKPAVLDANRNSVINGLINTRYICGRAEEELPGMMGLKKLYKWNEVNERIDREPEIMIDKVDVAILDPPRAGCDEDLLDAVARAEPGRIVYVSCDPGTLARDIKYLTAHGYKFIEATPVDQFPWTSHIECVCLLSNKKAKPMDYVQINDY